MFMIYACAVRMECPDSPLRVGCRVPDHRLAHRVMPTLLITRDLGYVDCLRRYRVLLDGELSGTIAPGGELRLEIGPGEHVVEARIDWCGSQPMRFAATGQHHLVIKSGLRGWRLVLAPVFALFLWRRYLTLDLDPPETE